MSTPNTQFSPATALQILERRADVRTERHEEAAMNLDPMNMEDWDQLWYEGVDARMSVWARNELHRLQHQTAKSILSST